MTLDKQTATSTRSENACTTDQFDRNVSKAVEAALYYPSLKGNPWDDDLLPSGD